MEILLAFLEGIVLITSPCILPVLPLVLAASAGGRRKRPFGVIVGFVLSFSAFALLSRQIVTSFGIDPNIIRNVSLVLLFLFGLVLLSETLSQKFSALTQGIANVGNATAARGEGFLSGVSLGLLIGLIWTPCAGPILAAVLVQVLRQQTDALSYGVIVAFALGAGVPMLIIALSGRTLINKFGFLASHTETIRKSFGVLILLSVAFMASGFDIESLTRPQEIAADKPLHGLENGLAKPYPAPAIAGIEKWFNSEPLSIGSLKGKVVLVDFWTYSCINCVRTLPYITAWDKKYRGQGLVIIGIHTPEFEFEKNAENVKAALAAHGIAYAVALDNHLATWSSFNNHYWPAHYLIDKNGNVVYTHFGEGKYEITENNIRYLLGLKGEITQSEHTTEIEKPKTPETYLGFARAASFAGENLPHDTDTDYQLPEHLPDNQWALDGKWNVGAEKITTKEKGASIKLHFTAKKVFLVLGNEDKPVNLSITLNDKPTGIIKVDHHSIYEIVSQAESEKGILKITSDGAGLEAYAFTFGN